MPTAQDIEQVMQEVGPLVTCLSESYPEKQAWHLVVDEDVQVLAEMAPSRGMLVLSGAVGASAGGDHARVYELMLRYAFVWDATQGLRLGLDDTGSVVHLLQDIAIDGLDAHRFSELLSDFVSRLRGWRTIVAQPVETLSDPERASALLEFAISRA